MKRIFISVLRRLVRLPQPPIVRKVFYRWLGVRFKENPQFSSRFYVVGDYENIELHDNAEICDGVFLLAKSKIIIGRNSTLGYQSTVLTSANPNAKFSALAKYYPAFIAPVVIGDDVWVGANATILPGVIIGDCSVIAAGAVVTRNVPSYSVVAGIPARTIKTIF